MNSGTALRGLTAGLVGVAAMTAAEKIEQMVTNRPNSFVPAHTLERLTGRLGLVAPGVAGAVEAAARRQLPLRLGRQRLAGPRGVACGVLEGDVHDRMVLAAGER